MKRLFDIVVGIVVGLAVLPISCLVALGVAFDSPGPIFFRQRRVGRHGAPFVMFKFRSMAVNADGPLLTAGGDSRITRFGRIIRNTKLDELPQLWNVIRGDMSLVGPRPEVPRYAAIYSPAERKLVFSVRPGITDPASIRFRDEAALLAGMSDPERYYIEALLPQKIATYEAYVINQSMVGDITILARTVGAVIARGHRGGA